MKALYKTALCSFAVFAVFAVSNPAQAQDIDTPGIFRNMEANGVWTFAEIREFDGALSGCWAGTAPVQGKLPLEKADMNLVAVVDGSDLIEKVGFIDVVSPMTESELGLLFPHSLVIGDPGSNGVYRDILMAKEKTGSGTVRIEGQLRDSLLNALATQNFAALNIADRSSLMFSLRGSGKTITLWRACRDQIKASLASQ